MRLRSHLTTAAAVALEPRFWWSLFSWPTASATSFLMVSRLLRSGIRPRTVIDVGANIGQFGVACAKLLPGCMVYCYEPVPACFARLERAAARLRNLRVRQRALAERAGPLTFHLYSYDQASSALPLSEVHQQAFPYVQERRQITVEASTLDREFERTPLDPPVLLKLDVQGYEAQVLRGARRLLDRTDYVLAETSFQPLYQGEHLFLDILRLLETAGLEFERPVNFLASGPSGAILQMDAVFRKRRRTAEVRCESA